MKEGLVQVYTGNGKGKTTLAVGAAVRAIGHGFRVCMIQFMKGGGYTGEYIASKKVKNFDLFQFGSKPIDPEADPDKNGFPSPEEERDSVREAFSFALEKLRSGKYDMVILDEANVAMSRNLLTRKQVEELVSVRDDGAELVFTGRGAPKYLIEMADLVTELREIKHPFEQGIVCRKGIDY